MKELNPFLYVQCNDTESGGIIGKVGWDGKQMTSDGKDEESTKFLEKWWKERLDSYKKELEGKTPQEILDYVWKNLNYMTYYTFKKPDEDD